MCGDTKIHSDSDENRFSCKAEESILSVIKFCIPTFKEEELSTLAIKLKDNDHILIIFSIL